MADRPLDPRHEVLFTQLREYRMEFLALTEGIEEARASIVPPGFRNDLRWHLGHVYVDQYAWVRALTGEPQPVAEAFETWFGFGTDPSAFSADTPSFHELRALLAGQPDDLQRRYGARLTERFAPVESGAHTIEQVLVRTIFHEGIHLGNVRDLLRFV